MKDIVKDIASTADINNNKTQEFELSKNIAALVEMKNANITKQTEETTDITSALLNLKWMNRQDLHPWLVKEEIYGATLTEIVKAHPELQNRIAERLETHYQRIRAKEADTLTITRRLAENSWRGS